MDEIRKVFSYKGYAVRTVIRDGEPWFVAPDFAKILGFNDAWSMTRYLDEDEKLNHQIGGAGQRRSVSIVSEAGLYSCILRSRKPEAKEFKRWITHEVIPSIRKHGAYMTPETIEKTLSDPDFIIGLATTLKKERQKRIEAEEQAELLKTENQALKPPAEKYKKFCDSNGYTTFTTIGKHFLNGMSAKIIKAYLQEWGILFKRPIDKVILPKKGYERFFGVFPFYRTGMDGKEYIASRTLKVTNEGIDFIIDLFRDHAVL